MSAYERATTAWALSASAGHDDGISAGTTPNRYGSSPTLLTASTEPPLRVSTIRPR